MTLVTQHVPDLKCVVLGDDSVGKTSMLMGYATHRYPTQYVPDAFDNYAGTLKVDGRRLRMQIIDTVHKDDNTPCDVYSDTDVFVVCFSVIQPESLTNVLEVYLPEIRTHSPHTPFILVGAQADLRNVDEILTLLKSTNQQPVSYADGLAIAKREGAACYIETSPEVEKSINRILNGAIASVLGERSKSCSIL